MALVAEYACRTIVLKQVLCLTEEVFSQPEILKKSYILPPQITQMGSELSTVLIERKHI